MSERKMDVKISVPSLEEGGGLLAVQVPIPCIYEAGHVVTVEEAEALDYARRIAIGTNLRRNSDFQELVQNEASETDINAFAAKYAETYKFGMKVARSSDPFTTRLRQFCREYLTRKAKKETPSATVKEITGSDKFKADLTALMQNEKARAHVRTLLEQEAGFEVE